MISPKMTPATKSYRESEDYKKLSHMQNDCLDGKVSESDYNDIVDIQRKKYPDVQSGMFKSYVKDGDYSPSR